MSAEVSLGDYVQLTCLALANGKPNIAVEFSATAGKRPRGGHAISPYEQNTFQESLETGSPEDVQMAGWKPLVESYRMKIYQPAVDPQKPMLHKLVVDIRGELKHRFSQL